MYERFTDRARQAMRNAAEIAGQRHHEFVGAEHLLMALASFAPHKGIAGRLFEVMQVDTAQLLEELDRDCPPGPEMVFVGNLPHTPRLKRTIESAMVNARDLKHALVGTEHLLLAISEASGIASGRLCQHGMHYRKLEAEILGLLYRGLGRLIDCETDVPSEPTSDQLQQMTTYELINMSDAYTFKAPSIEIAGACAVLLSTQYGAKVIDGSSEESTPVLLGWAEWLEDRKIDNDWVAAHAQEIADCYETFLIGRFEDRKDAEDAMALMSKEDRIRWRDERQDRRRTSMAKIGERAYESAVYYRELAKQKNSAKDTH